MTDFTIDELHIPESIDAPDALDFIEMTTVRNDIEAEIVGNYDLAYSPAELLPHWLDPYDPKIAYVARVDGRIVARGILNWRVEDGVDEGWLEIEVLSAFRRAGIGAALYDLLATHASAERLRPWQSYVLHKAADGETLPSPTGFGAVPLADPGTRFLLGRGYELQQVERFSRLPLPLPPRWFDELAERERLAADAGYRLVRWVGGTPEDRVADVAVLHQRMSTDAPSGGLDYAEERWDEERVRTLDELRAASPRQFLVAAVEYVPSGTLVAFTELEVPLEVDRAVAQADTLVLREHRGHGLGMLVKLANLKYLDELHPGHPSVTTFNAEENRHMLEVNEAIGFLPVGYGGGWKLDVTP